jgi:hypothetical protein
MSEDEHAYKITANSVDQGTGETALLHEHPFDGTEKEVRRYVQTFAKDYWSDRTFKWTDSHQDVLESNIIDRETIQITFNPSSELEEELQLVQDDQSDIGDM